MSNDQGHVHSIISFPPGDKTTAELVAKLQAVLDQLKEERIKNQKLEAENLALKTEIARLRGKP
jgi:hypothetical protein